MAPVEQKKPGAEACDAIIEALAVERADLYPYLILTAQLTDPDVY